eukprot:Gb_34436 [translate_table: standard]
MKTMQYFGSLVSGLFGLQ